MAERIPLGMICRIYDGPHATPLKTKSGPVYLGIDAITDDGKIDPSEYTFLSQEDYKKWTKRVTPTYGDIVFSYEATLGRYALIPRDFYGCLGRRLAIIRNISNEINTKWLYYYFRSPEWKNFIKSKTVKGSTVDRISIEDFPSYTIPKMSIAVQEKISSMLYKLDEKIAVNHLINDNLQQQLKLLYDYWFVQFDFPDENGKPYRSSGGEMVWNDTLKRQIPIGWSVKTIGEITTKNTTAYDYSSSRPTIDLSVMPSDSIALTSLNDSTNFSTNLFVMKKGDILVGGIRPYLHKAGIAPCDGVFAGTVHSFSVIKNSDYNYAAITLSSKYFFDYAANVSTGTKMPVISSEAIQEYAIPYSAETVERFNTVDLMKIISKNVQENIQLSKLRDWLLPMLMNGQAKIEN